MCCCQLNPSKQNTVSPKFPGRSGSPPTSSGTGLSRLPAPPLLRCEKHGRPTDGQLRHQSAVRSLRTVRARTMIAPVAYRSFHDQADRDGQRPNRRDLRASRHRAFAGGPRGRDRPGADRRGAANAGGCGAPSPWRRRTGRADRQERGRHRSGSLELRHRGGRGRRGAGAHQSRVRQRLDDARRPARGSLVPGSRARRIRRPSTRRGRGAGAHRRVRPPAARHRAQAARRSREPARGDGGRLRPRRRRHRQGRSEPHRRIRDVQGPGEAVRRRGGRREPAHRTPLPVPPLRHRSPAHTHPPVRVRGAAGTPRRARLTFHRRTRHSPIARARPRSDADGAPHLLRRPLRFAARGNRSRSAVRNAASHRRRGRRRLPERRRQVPVHPRRLRGHRGASARPRSGDCCPPGRARPAECPSSSFPACAPTTVPTRCC